MGDLPVRVIIEQRIYTNVKLAHYINRIFGKHQTFAWKFIAWLKRNPRLDEKLRGELVDKLITEETWESQS